MVVDSQGNLFGTTGGNSEGAAFPLEDNPWGDPPWEDGTVFQVVPGCGSIATLASFTDSNGTSPYGGLIEDSQGNLFGITYDTVFEVAAGSGTITTLASFNGSYPVGSLYEDSRGNLFGTAYNSDGDSVFELAQGSGTITTLASFNGADPEGGLVEDNNGHLFGITSDGGTYGEGMLFEVTNLVPVITSSTASLPANAISLTITGTGFDTNLAYDCVTFSGDVRGIVTAATTTSLTVSLSGLSSLTGGTAFQASVTVDGISSGSAVPVATLAPVVTPSSTWVSAQSTALTIVGSGFDTNPANDTVTFSGGVTGTVTSATATQLTVSKLSGLSRGVLNASVRVDNVRQRQRRAGRDGGCGPGLHQSDFSDLHSGPK